jgi:hypothetical protein
VLVVDDAHKIWASGVDRKINLSAETATSKNENFKKNLVLTAGASV